MREEATSLTQPANPIQDTSVHLTGTNSKEQKHGGSTLAGNRSREPRYFDQC